MLRDKFLKKAINVELPFYNKEKKSIYKLTPIQKITEEEVKDRRILFFPFKKETLKKLFKIYESNLRCIFSFLKKKLSKNSTYILNIEGGLEKESKIVITLAPSLSSLEKHEKSQSFSFIPKLYDINEIKKDIPLHSFFCQFAIYIHAEIHASTILHLEKKVEKLQEKTNSKQLVKTPINMFNVILSDKASTIIKIEKKINEIERKIAKAIMKKEKKILCKMKKVAIKLLEKAKINFPEDFHFTVYQHYAIFGGMILLYQNNFKPVEFNPTAILRALNFSNINKSEISKIKKAFSDLTTSKFPCYYIREDKKDSNVIRFSNIDVPIFLIYEEGQINLNVNLVKKNFAKKKLYLCILNRAIADDIPHFFAMIDNNLLANLRKFKQVNEDDLYFMEFLIREKRFHMQTRTNFNKICKIMKKTEWLGEFGKLNRDHKRRLKNKVKNLLIFSIGQGLVKKYKINPEGSVLIEYRLTKKRKNTLIINRKPY